MDRMILWCIDNGLMRIDPDFDVLTLTRDGYAILFGDDDVENFYC